MSVDDLSAAQEMVDTLGLKFPVLYDPDHTVVEAYGLFDLLNDGVSAPATYVFAADGTLIAYHIGQSISDRPPVGEIVKFLVNAR